MRAAAGFGLAFVAGAVAVYGLAAALGSALGIAELSLRWRFGIGAAGLLGLAAVDVAAIRASRYCGLGWRRQTPKVLMRRFRPTLVACVWGFDTGLAVTTFRVAAGTWGALLLAGLGFTSWRAGLGYGLGFAVPFLGLLLRHRVGRWSRDPEPGDPGLEPLLARRALLQTVSAVLLLAGGGLLLAGLAGVGAQA